MKKTEQNFWNKVLKTEICWEWIGCKVNIKERYGLFWANNKKIRAHRYSYLIHKGEIPNAMHVLHTCDNPSCVNPSHLFLGTNMDNVQDKISKNRHLVYSGEKNGRAKLTENQIKQIRKLYNENKCSQKELALNFCVGRTAIGKIIRKERWSFVD